MIRKILLFLAGAFLGWLLAEYIKKQRKKEWKRKMESMEIRVDKPVPTGPITCTLVYDEPEKEYHHDNSGEIVPVNWIVFNQGTNLEFAECSWCEHEIEPDVTVRNWYPDVCPKCGAAIAGRVRAEDVEG